MQKTNSWLKDIMHEMEWQERSKAYQALRSALHALRDRLTVDEVAQLAAQLPMLVRGFYYEGWDPTGKPLKVRDLGGFLATIALEFRDDDDVDPDQVARAVFTVLARRITRGELEDIEGLLPKEVRHLWPRAETMDSQPRSDHRR